MMRVWVYTEKQWAEYPATRWVCEWATDPKGILKDDDRWLGAVNYEYANFGSRGKGLAIAKAKQIIRDGIDCFGAVQVVRESLEIVHGDTASWERDPDTLIEITHSDI